MTPQEHDLLTRTAVNLENLTTQFEAFVDANAKQHAANKKLLEEYITRREFAPYKWALMTIIAIILGGAINAFFSGYNSLEGLSGVVESESQPPPQVNSHDSDYAFYTKIP